MQPFDNNSPDYYDEPVKTQTKQTTSTPPAKPAVTCTTAMTDAEFSAAKEMIKRQSFAQDQVKVARQVAKNNCLSVKQIKEIVGLFSFENDKLDYAMYAYDFTVDKKNFFLLNDSFNFSSSKDKLNGFLEGK